MRDLTGRVERLEKKIGAGGDSEFIVLTVPYGVEPEIAQKRALEERGLTLSDIGAREVVFITSYARHP